LVHPITGSALGGAEKPNPLKIKFEADEGVEIDSPGDHITAEHFRATIANLKGGAKFIVDFAGEESNLAFVARFVVEKAIPFDSGASDAMELFLLKERMITGRLAVMAEEVVARGEVEVLDADRGHERGRRGVHAFKIREETRFGKRGLWKRFMKLRKIRQGDYLHGKVLECRFVADSMRSDV
jgi:hypothetical protein